VVGSVGEVGEHLRARATLQVGWMGPEEHQRRLSTVARARWRWRDRVEWRELDGNCGESSDRLLFRTEGEGVRCRAGGCMRGAWSGSGGWSAASAVRWLATAQLSRTRGQCPGAGYRRCTRVAVTCVARGSREAGGSGRR
jgi:hypothetical protein